MVRKVRPASSSNNRHEQAVARDILRIQVAEKRLPIHLRQLPEPRERLCDLRTSPPDDVGVQRHAAEASRTAWRRSGARS